MGDAVINDVADELREFITSRSLHTDVKLSEDRVILAAKTSDKTLTIICHDQTQFHLKESQLRNGVQRQVYGKPGRYGSHGRPYTRNEMLAEVKQWLEKQH
jgi:hypothetical protein